MKKSEFERLKILSKRIDKSQANKSDFEEFEDLLQKAGFSEEKIKSVMIENGFDTYEEYIEGLKNAKTYEEKRIVMSVIKGFLIGLSIIVIMWVINKVIETTED